ncbi:MAG: SDR family oxidoreductase [Thalassococcus sp.]|uniref:SDR family oxidoreductase n=1 Tax=Thalassococcus sp. TaxID=1928858 RepID=UPI001B069A0C|nr:SDR family oxidoreductase [Thalassococcus sp.]MBO6868812.1 SDR family oxidoreductase [Thalassococcus sp.]
MQKTVLISGGSRGIGRATGLEMAGQGWRVAFTYRGDQAAADQTVADIHAAGSEAIAIQSDTANEADVLRAFDEAISAFGGLDAVVVNAGVVAPSSKLADMSIERLRTMFDTNVLGAFLFAREAARRLPAHKSGADAAIVLLSSAAARLGSPNEYVDYAATKGAIDTMTIGLSKELAPDGIRVNGVRPGLIETDIHASGGQPDRAERLGKTAPLGRAGTADEVANAIAWLCSAEASYCTGSILDVAGGR